MPLKAPPVAACRPDLDGVETELLMLRRRVKITRVYLGTLILSCHPPQRRSRYDAVRGYTCRAMRFEGIFRRPLTR